MSATIGRALVWLVFLGIVGAALTVCSGPATTLIPPTEVEVAALPTPVPSGATDVPLPPSPTPAPETDTPPPATDTPQPPSPTLPPPTDTPVSPTDTPEPEPEPEEVSATDTPEPEPEPDVDVAALSSDNCVGCHTNQETLQALAEEKEVKSEASSGEG
jgi:outer membrane biosynthesis protein TonB